MARERLLYEKWIHQEEVLQREWRKWTELLKRDENAANTTGTMDSASSLSDSLDSNGSTDNSLSI